MGGFVNIWMRWLWGNWWWNAHAQLKSPSLARMNSEHITFIPFTMVYYFRQNEPMNLNKFPIYWALKRHIYNAWQIGKLWANKSFSQWRLFSDGKCYKWSKLRFRFCYLNTECAKFIFKSMLNKNKSIQWLSCGCSHREKKMSHKQNVKIDGQALRFC